MKALPLFLALLITSGVAFGAEEPTGPIRVAIEPFITLPADVRHPEGLTSDPRTGDLFVGTFDAREPATQRNNQVLRYSSTGKLLARYPMGATPLTGLAYAYGKLYILNFGASKLQRLEANFTAQSVLEDVASFGMLDSPAVRPRAIANPDGSADRVTYGSSGFPALNGMVFDGEGHLYISDSFQGAIYRIDSVATCKPCAVTTVSRDPLLATAGHLPFGANGLAFGTDPSVLFINNAGDGRILKLSLPTAQMSVLTESIPGADGLMFHEGLLWVAANQADVIYGVDEQGLIRVRAGDFAGIQADGSPKGLLFPAGTAVSGRWMVVANLALPLTPVQGDEWEERVTRWNLVRFRLPAVR